MPNDETQEALVHDEVTQYDLSRYISASEGSWRFYYFPIQRKQPPVKMLVIHLEDEEVITFDDQGDVQNLVDSGPTATTLTAFFDAMTQHPDMRHLVYPEIFQHFTYL